MSDAFTPSQVDLGGSFPPLCATMGRTEREAAATLIVRALQLAGGDEWRAVGPKEMGEAIKADLDSQTEPLHSLNRNPFWRPDFWDLVDKGFARWTGPETGKGPLELTDVGVEALRRWVRPQPSQPPGSPR